MACSRTVLAALAVIVHASLAGCTAIKPTQAAAVPTAAPSFYGTLEPFAEHAVYFVLTDRFVNGDPGNDHREQGKAKGAAYFTFDRPTPGGPKGGVDNIGYLGGDFKGIVDNAEYIRGMGFGAVWITPIVDNPDEAFTGGKPAVWGGSLTDRGKTGYHGYWGVNFYKLDEHLPSPGLDFAGFTQAMHAHGLKVALDVVANHGSPAYSMPAPQPPFGQVFDKEGRLIADHQNLAPEQLDPRHNPLHAFYNTRGGLAELSDFNENNPQVMEYLAGAYAQWLDQGADAFRIDTIGWMPHAFWKEFAARMRAKRPGLFMFGENFDYNAQVIAPHTWPANGGVSVLDFPLKKAVAALFETPGSDYVTLGEPLHLENGPYANPYELATFYDNHDMARMNASDDGFIDANNWLFTARGIPVVYYGSETGFMRGTAEHMGNRNYFGQQRIDAAPQSRIYQALKRIAQVRAQTPALQRGLQVNVELQGDRAAFYRVYQHQGQHQIALVLLNKGDAPTRFDVTSYMQPGRWRSALGSADVLVAEGEALSAQVPAHGVEIYVLDAAVKRTDFLQRLTQAMQRARGR